MVKFLPEGPSELQLQQGSTYVMAITKNETSEVSVALKGPEAYLFTALCLREISAQVLKGSFAAGFQTPAYFGKVLLNGIDNIEWEY